jgi:transposase InsO family protein
LTPVVLLALAAVSHWQTKGLAVVLVELSVVEQRLLAVMEVVRDGAAVSEVAGRYGVSRQSVHNWLRRYATGGLDGLRDRSHRPNGCPHQMPAAVEARLVELRRAFPEWGPVRLAHQLAKEGVEPLPGRTSVYRALVRNQLVPGRQRRRRRGDYRRWERQRPMELWQLDVMGGVVLADGTELKLVTGVDDHSRYCVAAGLVRRATGRAVCGVFTAAMGRHGVPEEVLTDNGKQFTGRFGPYHGEVLFDRICREHGIVHRLTKPRSPTTTGKVERLHRTLRREFLAKHTLTTLEQAQQALDEFVAGYNTTRPHQALGMVPPAERFRPGQPLPVQPVQAPAPRAAPPPADPEPADAGQPHGAALDHAAPLTVTRTVTSTGVIGLAGTNYSVGRALAGQQVQARCVGAVVQVLHCGELVRVLPRRHDPTKPLPPGRVPGGDGAVPLDQASRAAPLGDLASDPTVVRRKVDPRGQLSFAGRYYHAGREHAGRTVLVRCHAGVVQVVHQGRLVRAWTQRHTPAQQERLHQRPDVQQRTANRRPVG